MLNKNALKKIGLTECEAMFGGDFLRKHSDLALAFYGMQDGLFRYGIGLDTKEAIPKDDNVIVIGETPMEYYAIVFIDPITGAVKRDMINSILPN